VNAGSMGDEKSCGQAGISACGISTSNSPVEATMKKIAMTVWVGFLLWIPFSAAAQSGYEYRVLATNRTSTMEKEMNLAAEAGFRFEGTMGGETAFGGSEAVSIMSKPLGKDVKQRYEYKLLATTRTSTMQKELQEAGDAGFLYKDQTAFKTTFGGKEVVVILERDREAPIQKFEYKLLATSRTSTMEKELKQAGDAGFEFIGITVGNTSMGGSEVISILRRATTK
jgi:hypothetical protein